MCINVFPKLISPPVVLNLCLLNINEEDISIQELPHEGRHYQKKQNTHLDWEVQKKGWITKEEELREKTIDCCSVYRMPHCSSHLWECKSALQMQPSWQLRDTSCSVCTEKSFLLHCMQGWWSALKCERDALTLTFMRCLLAFNGILIFLLSSNNLQAIEWLGELIYLCALKGLLYQWVAMVSFY